MSENHSMSPVCACVIVRKHGHANNIKSCQLYQEITMQHEIVESKWFETSCDDHAST
jgi:hypothetical protein